MVSKHLGNTSLRQKWKRSHSLNIQPLLIEYEKCLFENTYGFECNDVNKGKVYKKDSVAWANPKALDDSMWEDANESFRRSLGFKKLTRASHDLMEEFKEAARGESIKSLALSALVNSFLVSDSGI
ncbi:CYPRO4 protein [Tanacetum coccineum]